MRVLIAESNPKRMRQMHDILEADGRFRTVSESFDGDSTVRNAQAADVVVIDHDIRGRGWLGTVSEVLRRKDHPAIILVTPATQAAVHEATRREGVNDVVVWPTQVRDLPERLAALESPDP